MKKNVPKQIVNKQVYEIMKKEIYMISDKSTLYDAIKMLIDYQTSELIVYNYEKQQMVGFISDKDIIKLFTKEPSKFFHAQEAVFYFPPIEPLDDVISNLNNINVMNIAIKRPLFINADCKIYEIAKIMLKKHINMVPVLENEKIIGVVKKSDIMSYLYKWVR